MKNLSIRNADSLYWIGRYLERFSVLTKESVKAFDYIIDIDKDEGKKFFEKIGHNIDYINAFDFFEKAVKEVLLPCAYSARENAISLRDIIEDNAFAAINMLYVQLDSEVHPTPKFVENLLSNLYGFWGIIFLKTVKSKANIFLEFGQITEAIDLNLRIFEDVSTILFDIEKLNHLGRELSSEYINIAVNHSDIKALLGKVNSKIGYIIHYEN